MRLVYVSEYKYIRNDRFINCLKICDSALMRQFFIGGCVHEQNGFTLCRMGKWFQTVRVFSFRDVVNLA